MSPSVCSSLLLIWSKISSTANTGIVASTVTDPAETASSMLSVPMLAASARSCFTCEANMVQATANSSSGTVAAVIFCKAAMPAPATTATKEATILSMVVVNSSTEPLIWMLSVALAIGGTVLMACACVRSSNVRNLGCNIRHF